MFCTTTNENLRYVECKNLSTSMADQDAKTEISKEVLAPAEGVREDLIATAVKFLQNAKVQQSALSQKKAFLQRKGLTTEEIEIAVQRAGIQQNNVSTTVPSNTGYQGGVAMQQGTSPDIPVRATEDVSKWMKARHILAVVTMVSGISYAAYKLYKEFFGPWLFGIQTADKRLEKLEKIVAESVTNVNTTLTSIEETLGKQQEKIQMLSHDVNRKVGESGAAGQSTGSISEIKSELSSIKGLLLNRRQFPAMPTSTPALPAWQLVSNSGDADSNNKGKNDNDESTAEIRLSSSPAVTQDEDIDLNVKDQDESDMFMSEKDSGIVTENSKIEAVNLQDGDIGDQNIDSIETESPRSEILTTKTDKESEENESND